MTVSKLGGTFTKSDIFETTILFSGGISHVQYYPSWDQDKDPIWERCRGRKNLVTMGY